MSSEDSSPAAAKPEINAETRERLIRAKLAAASFGGIVGLLTRAEEFKHLAIADLDWLVLPAVVRGQVALLEAEHGKTGSISVLAAVLWANVSPEVDQRLSSNLNVPPRLTPDEWSCGNIPWIIVAAGDRKALPQLLRKLAETRFGAAGAKLRISDSSGKVVVGQLRPGGKAETSD